ncbi:hypothetical protein ACTXT7_015711 [Hymenolepis weldensis]
MPHEKAPAKPKDDPPTGRTQDTGPKYKSRFDATVSSSPSECLGGERSRSRSSSPSVVRAVEMKFVGGVHVILFLFFNARRLFANQVFTYK